MGGGSLPLDSPATDREQQAVGDGDGCPRPVRVLLVEDDRCAATTIVTEFSRGDVIVEVARSLKEARCQLRSGRAPDVVVAKAELPDGAVDTLLADVEVLGRQPSVVITEAPPELSATTLEHRPILLGRPIGPAALLSIVRVVADGFVRPVLRAFVSRFGLSRRESEALLLLCRGLKAKQIAAQMQCTEPTTYGHLSRVCRKTGCADSQEVLAKLFATACQARGHALPDASWVRRGVPASARFQATSRGLRSP